MDMRLYIDELYEKVSRKEITTDYAVEQIAVAIQTDFPLFKLQRYDEDIRSSVVLAFLKNGYSLFERFDFEYGSTFHNYVISFVKGLALTEKKMQAIEKIREKVDFIYSQENYSTESQKYSFSIAVENNRLLPYEAPESVEIFKPKKILTPKEFMQIRTSNVFAKPTLVIALRSCFDITDTMIETICSEYNLNSDIVYKDIQDLKNSRYELFQRHKELILSRNEAFSNRRRYSPDIADYEESTENLQETYKARYEHSTELWIKRNASLKKGKFHYFPSNEMIAEKLGICPRQVGYYISRAKELFGQAEEE